MPSIHIPLIWNQRPPNPKIQLFWDLNSNNQKLSVKVMDEVKVQGHIVGPISQWFISLLVHVSRPSHSWNRVISHVDLENLRSRSWSRSQSGSDILLTHISFILCRPTFPFLRYSYLKIWSWKSKVKVTGKVQVQDHIVGPTSCLDCQDKTTS